MPLAALLVVQEHLISIIIASIEVVSMPLAALLVVQANLHHWMFLDLHVSMPLAALLVVQAHHGLRYREIQWFQCRSRLCWWCKVFSYL